jgi:hypothetical protein
MAGSKDQVVVSVIAGLTRIQAANILADITNAKSKHAPLGRGTIAKGSIHDIGELLGKGIKKISKK